MYICISRLQILVLCYLVYTFLVCLFRRWLLWFMNSICARRFLPVGIRLVTRRHADSPSAVWWVHISYFASLELEGIMELNFAHCYQRLRCANCKADRVRNVITNPHSDQCLFQLIIVRCGCLCPMCGCNLLVQRPYPPTVLVLSLEFTHRTPPTSTSKHHHFIAS